MKVKLSNPNNNKGKSSGLRCICIVASIDGISLVLTIYAKDGSKQKDDLTEIEQKIANKLFYEYIETSN